MRASHRGALAVPFRALATQRIAVNGERMQEHLGVSAIRLGALPLAGGMVDQSPMAVRQVRCTVTAGVSHESLLTSPRGAIPMPRRDCEHSEVRRLP